VRRSTEQAVGVIMGPVTVSHAASAQSGGFGAYLEAALDAVVVADAFGRVVEFNAAAVRTFGYAREEALGRTLAELIVPPSLRERHSRAFARFVETREERLFGRRLELTGMRADGSEFPVELALSKVEGEPLLICGAVRDLSEAKRKENDLRRLAAEQAALRRVATLVAREATPAEVFAALAEEVARLLEVPLIETVRYEPDGTATVIGAWGENPFPVGSNWTLDGPSITASVLQTGRPARIDDYTDLSGTIADVARKAGFCSAVGVPIIVSDRTWGAIYAVSTEPEPLPPDTEGRLADFTELVGTAIANTEVRDDLRKSEELYRRTITQAGAVPYLYDYAQDRYTFIGEGIEDLTGYAAAEFTPGAWGRMIDETILLGDQAGLTNDEAVRRTRSGEFPRWRCDQRISTRHGESRWISDASVEILGRDGQSIGAIGMLQDITERKRTEEEVGRLAEEHAALRRVATLVAEQASPTEVFAAVADEVCRTLDVPLIEMSRFEADGTVAVIGAAGEHPFRPGTRWPLDGPTVSKLVLETGRPAKVDYEGLPGAIADAARQAGLRTGLGVPIMVDGAVWGVIATASTADEPLPDDTEARLADFTELVATAISNTQARDELQRLAHEQAALRRVATLIARQATPARVFAAVAKEVAQVLNVPLTAVVRYEPERVATQVGVWGAENPFPVGTSWTLDDQSVSGLVFRTGLAARVSDYSEVPGPISTALAREAGIRTAVGVPILVDGTPWGVMMALSTERQELPADTEARLAAFTELIATAISNIQARDDLRDLADEQAALRRVATLVARGTHSADVFEAVCAETGELLGATSVNLVHFTADGFNLTKAGWSLRDTHVPAGTRLPIGTDTINGLIQQTVAPARFDSYEESSGELATLIRQRGIRSEIGAPVIVEGKVWGALIAGTDSDELLPAGAELRLASFAGLIATAISNATTRSELIASRARIVAASDAARRRIERDLHDGAQQRLVALGLDLQAVQMSIPRDLPAAHSGLERVRSEIEAVLEGIRELSRGLHPALLSQRGLGPSLSALARRSPIQVNLEIDVEKRPPESIETAAYYVVSEALTNAAKHSEASEVLVTVATTDDVLRVTIEDDGIGGAEASAGSGLVGLIDRVEALGGDFALDSLVNKGTRIAIELPLVVRLTSDAAPTTKASPSAVQGGVATSGPDLELGDASTMLAAVGGVLADALYVVDAQGRIRFLNAQALKILGYEDERQLLGRPSHDTIHYLRRDGMPFPAAECPLLRPRVTGETVGVEDDCFVRQDGSLVPVAYSSAPISLPDGRGAVVSFRQVSQ
jgi:PAS domain S-box-containing protein